jgi:hypothetical protein
MKKFIIVLVIIIIAVAGVWYVTKNKTGENQVTEPTGMATTTTPGAGTDVLVTDERASGSASIIGRSVEENEIMAYHFGTGTTEILFVGGIHGGYEWNTAAVAEELVNYLEKNPNAIPSNLKVTVIPVLNPDGLKKVTGTTTGNFAKADVSTSQDVVVSGRFNGNTVDLNRNFDCDWSPDGKWQNKEVSGGKVAFSEPESEAIKNYVEKYDPRAVIAWYSSAGGVYASNCHNGVSNETREAMNAFAKASGYPAHDDFNFYEVTGDMTNWLAKIGVTSFSVLLTNHTDTEWTKNLAGVKALLSYYAE